MVGFSSVHTGTNQSKNTLKHKYPLAVVPMNTVLVNYWILTFLFIYLIFTEQRAWAKSFVPFSHDFHYVTTRIWSAVKILWCDFFRKITIKYFYDLSHPPSPVIKKITQKTYDNYRKKTIFQTKDFLYLSEDLSSYTCNFNLIILYT